MKNKFNLIEWLWKTESHEKQKMRSGRQYAAMLLMLLTLGVGQMWAATIFNCGIDVNDTWYKGTGTINSGNWLGSKTAFNNANLGALTSMTLGGQYDTWDNNQTDYCSWNSNNGIHILIKKGSTQIASFKLTCYHDSKSGNNNTWKTKGGTGSCSDSGSWGTYSVDISGYAAGNDYTIKATWTSPSSVSTNATASFTINPVVTFNANGGTGSDYTQTVTYNTNTALTANTFSKTGYDFAGWATSADGDVVYTNQANVKLTAHTTLYAKWTAHNYTASNNIKHADGTTAGQYNVDYDATSISYTTTPSKTGYNIVGLYKQAAFTNKIVNNNRTLVASTSYTTSTSKWNQTSAPNLYVKWEAKTYTESGNLKETDGTSNGKYTATYDATSIAINTAPTKSGYHVEGYYISTTINAANRVAEPNGTLVANVSGWTNANGKWIKDAKVPLYINWESDDTYFTIRYAVGTSYTSMGDLSAHDNTASADLGESPQSILSGHSITFTAEPNTGYEVVAWYTNAACNTGEHDAGSTTYNIVSLGADQNVYVKFQPITYSISYTLYGGTNSGSNPSSYTIESSSITLQNPTKTGYTFGGWYDNSSFTGSAITTISSGSTGDVSLFAKWTAKTTTVTLDQQSGSGGTTGVTATYDAAMPDADMPTRTGYDFGGYYTETAGSGTQYYTNTGASARNWNIEDDTKTLYAKWTLITYTITYNNMTGATNHLSNPANYNVTTATITLGTPTKTGYTFGGWFTDDGVWNNQVTSIPLGSTGNKVLYAKWTAKNYDITYVDANNVATIAANPSTGSTDATINFTVTLKDGYKNLSVTAVDASSNTVTVTNPSSNNYRFTMPASAVTVTVSATALPIVYVLKTKHASSSLGDGATGFPSDGKIWAWKASGDNNFYTSPGDFPGPTAASKATVVTDDIIGDEWYRFIPDNTNYFDGSTAYHVIMTSTGRILDTQSTFIEDGSSQISATHTGTVWIVPHGTGANTAYLYTSYPDMIATPYNVTYNAGDHGDVNILETTITSGNSQTILTNRNSTLTATPASGYAFNRWITTGSVTVADATSATTTVIASAAGGTVTATYFEVVNSGWYIKGDPAGGDWSSPTSLPLNRLLPGETNVYYRPVTLPGNNQHFRFWKGANEYGASSKDLVVTKETKYTLYTNNGLAFRYSDGGTVWLVVDESANKCWVQDPVEFYPVNFGYGSGCNTFTAKDGEDHDLVSGNTYVNGTALTFTQTKKDGYTFVGWNTAADGSGSSLGTGSTYSVASLSGDVNVYAIYREHKTAITITTDEHGTITTPASLSNPYNLGVETTQAINASPNTGYHWNTWTVSGNAVLASSAATQSNTVKGNGTDGGTGTVTATFTANTYQVQFHRNGGAGDVVYQDFTYDAAQNLTANTYTRTGYNFAGWALTTDGAVTYTDGAEVSNLTSENGATFHLYAKWNAKTTTITLDQTGAASSGSVTTRTGTYNADMPAITGSGSLPTAPQGYAFMGYYDALAPLGTQYYDETGASARTWNKEDATATLYAYFKKAEITELSLAARIVGTASTDSITVTPTISPTPVGAHVVCWNIQYSNGTSLPSQPEGRIVSGNTYRFKAPNASATYQIEAKLHLDNCEGEVLSTRTTTFQVAGKHDVTILYKDASGNTIKASEGIADVDPLEWSDPITAPTITGYTFHHWLAGDGITLSENGSTAKTGARPDSSLVSTVYIQAVYDGTLTAVYTKKRMIYFYNTLGWGSVYVYFYKNDSYWQTGSPYNGSGANTSYTWTNTPYSEGKHGQMLPVSEGSNIYYFDAEAAGVNASYDDVVFTEHQQHGYNYFYETNAARRGDYKSSMPMFVPLADQTADVHNKTNYYNSGYWMNYPENTGYTLKIYNAWDATKETAAVREFAFPYSEDIKMPLKMDVEFNDGGNHEYWFMVYRNDGTYMGAIRNFDQNHHAEQAIEENNNKPKLITSAPGNYTFTLTYHNNGLGTNNYYIDVDFPIAVGDYRIVYKDNATWSQAAHGASWNHPSHPITKATDAKKDTISFFVTKGDGITQSMKFQYASAISDAGAVTWSDVDGGSITIPSNITESGVYNFIVSQPAGGASISLEKAESYAGEFYIRTDCAGDTKWDSFKNIDHQMTYSDYTENNEGYSHYFAHWVESSTNVKFVIANDYSMCVSDTLIADYGTTIANISNVGALNSASANIRFMWNQATNKISRAYIGGSGNIEDRFLVLEGDAKMFDENGTALTEPNRDHVTYNEGLPSEITKYLDKDNQVILHDNQNFVYERTIQVKTTARAKLTAKYNNNVQYFKGSEGTFADGTTIELLGGDAAGKHTMRIVYDFKTNRLVTAYIPSGTIEEDLAINADLMIVREHQEAGQQLLFNGGSLSKVHTVYGVMRFNRWTLNNKETTGAHSPVGDPKSAYERGLYWISFPFDVKLSDVFGFGTYGTHWIIEEYDGTKRAKDGYWADSKSFWGYVMPSQRPTFVLKAGQGYVLALDLDLMKDNNTTFWTNNIEQVELFFPSASFVEEIEATDVTTSADSHLYDAAAHPGHTDDRTYKDSHWNMIGVPSYANYGETLTSDGSTVITWQTPTNANLPYLYEWNMVDDTYTPQTGTTYPFKSMHAYMVQYHGEMHWSLASATPQTLAPRRNSDALRSVEFKLELQQNDKMTDQTFVKLSNEENIHAGFAFDEDLSKEFNKRKANIYTIVENNTPVAGNTLPMTEQTTVIPVGVKIVADGEYTFAIPEGTNGTGVTLIDTYTGVSTPLGLTSYTVDLEAGTYDSRFVLEISPVKQMPTDIESTDVSHQNSAVRKVLIDNMLYIVKDGEVFDARGAKVK